MDQRRDIGVLLSELAVSIANSLGLVFYDVEFRRSGQKAKLRVFIDHEDRCVSLEDCEQFSRQISRELDVLDLIHVAYDLEVSSPGLDRHLRTTEHWKRAIGGKVRVKYRDREGNARAVIASVLELHGEQIRLRGEDGTDLGIELSAVQSARAHVDW
jgi:ribosome maturation factor RimP